MTQTTWLMLAIAVVAVVIGFLAGRLSAPRERQFQETRSELERVQKERDELRDSVENHFQHTAALFGNLSRDYRALYLHFAEGARSMGLGEEPARRLIEEAREPVEETADGPDAPAGDPLQPDSGTHGPAAPAAAGAEPRTRGDTDTTTAAGTEAEPPSEAETTAAETPRMDDGGAETTDTRAAENAGDATEPETRARDQGEDSEARPDASRAAADEEKAAPRRDNEDTAAPRRDTTGH